MSDGWIKLHRQITEWEWWEDHNATRLFLYLLLECNHRPKKWRGIIINEGERVTSLASLSEATGLTIRQTRVALDKLILTGEVTNKSTNKYRIIKINKWTEYQMDDKQMTSKRQATRQTNDNKQECKEIKKEKNNIYTPEDLKNFLEAVTETIGEKKFTSAAREKLKARLKSYTVPELAQAFQNLHNEPDKWKINNNGHRSLAWWLHSDERIEEMLNCHQKKVTKTGGVVFAGTI